MLYIILIIFCSIPIWMIGFVAIKDLFHGLEKQKARLHIAIIFWPIGLFYIIYLGIKTFLPWFVKCFKIAFGRDSNEVL